MRRKEREGKDQEGWGGEDVSNLLQYSSFEEGVTPS